MSSGLSLDAAIAALVAQSIAEVRGTPEQKPAMPIPDSAPAPQKPSIAERLGVSFHHAEEAQPSAPELDAVMPELVAPEAVAPEAVAPDAALPEVAATDAALPEVMILADQQALSDIAPTVAAPPTVAFVHRAVDELAPQAKLAPLKGSTFKQFKAVANRLSEARKEPGDAPVAALPAEPVEAEQPKMAQAAERIAEPQAPVTTAGSSMWGMATPDDEAFVRLPGVELAVAAAVEAAEAKTRAAPDGKTVRHNVLRRLTSRIFTPSKIITPQPPTSLHPTPAKAPEPPARPSRPAFAEISPEDLEALAAKVAPRAAIDNSQADRATPAGILPALPIILPVPVLVAAALFGDRFCLLALFVTLLVALAADDLIALGSRRNRSRAEGGSYWLEKVLGVVHFPVLALGIYALGGGTGLSLGAWFALFFALALYGAQISGSIAHALIHAPDTMLRKLGNWIFVSFLYPHHAAAHRRIHHRFVATTNDPSTAEAGQGFWHYLPFAWAGTCIASYEIEKAVMPSRLGSRAGVVHPFVLWYGGALAITVAILAVFGLGAWLAYVLLCALVQLQLLLADYVEHYGLKRARDSQGRVEPVRPQHVWAAPKILPAAWRPGRAHLPDHQANPARRSAIGRDRRANTGARPSPALPWPMSIMVLTALVPPLWRRMMDPRLAALEGRPYGGEPSGMQANIG